MNETLGNHKDSEHESQDEQGRQGGREQGHQGGREQGRQGGREQGRQGENAQLINGQNLQRGLGSHTRFVLEEYANVASVDAMQAMNEMNAKIIPFSERLCSYVALHFHIEDSPEAVRAKLKAINEQKGLSISSANLSQWLKSEKKEVYLSARSIFKLCLAMELDLQASALFVYDCLYQNWFNYRSKEEVAYLFFLGLQKFFGDKTYETALEYLSRSDLSCDAGLHIELGRDATGYTKTLGSGIRRLLDSDCANKQDAFAALDDFFVTNEGSFTGVQRSAIRTYTMYLTEGSTAFKSLAELYASATGLTLPETSYLDMTCASTDPKKKRLLWGTMHRKDWIAKNGRDWDVLHDQEIRLEHHAVERMTTNGVLRGNIVALLFFHFCFEHEEEFNRATNVESRKKLFERFYRTTNLTLQNECGMLPLHPRKHFDRLFLSAISNSGAENPIVYLNKVLEKFYRV